MKQFYTTTNNPKFNSKVEKFNGTILAELRHYVINHLKQWDTFKDELLIEYNKQVNVNKNFPPFEFIPFRTIYHTEIYFELEF